MAQLANARKKPAAAPERAEPDWYVIDINARNPIVEKGYREHTPVLGFNYKIPGYAAEGTYGCPMPPQHAMKFLHDQAFEVFDNKGAKVEPIRVPSSQQGNQPLQPHQTIATFYELRKDALIRRAIAFPGGNAFNQNSPIEAVVEFLVTQNSPTRFRKVEHLKPKVSVQAPALAPAEHDDITPIGNLQDAGEPDLEISDADFDGGPDDLGDLGEGGPGDVPPEFANLSKV